MPSGIIRHDLGKTIDEIDESYRIDFKIYIYIGTSIVVA